MKRNSVTTTFNAANAANAAMRSDVLTIGLSTPTDVGPILRQIHREQPRALLVWIDASDTIARAELIAELRRRRPQLPLIALANESNARLEQAARIAGASFYFPMVGSADELLLSQTLGALGIDPPVPREHSPPAARGSPGPPGRSTTSTGSVNRNREILSGDQS